MANGKMTKEARSDRRSRQKSYLEVELIGSPLQHPQPATRVQFGLGAVLHYSNTSSLRVAGFEDEDEAPCESSVGAES
jgi:hypothetical protein